MRVIRLGTTDSTMLEARRRLAAGERTPFTVIADCQTGGVGRLGRPWSSPLGGWWLTVAVTQPVNRRTLRDDIGLGVAHWVCAVCEATLASALGTGPPRLSIKWPNDVMAGDLKLAGVLIELIQAPASSVALVGVGINADVEVAALDADVHKRATSLRTLMNRSIDPSITAYSLRVLPEKIQEKIEWTPAPGVIASMVRPHLWGVGRTVPITLPDGTRVQGRIDGLTDDGNLLATIDGEQRTLRSVEQIG